MTVDVWVINVMAKIFTDVNQISRRMNLRQLDQLLPAITFKLLCHYCPFFSCGLVGYSYV